MRLHPPEAAAVLTGRQRQVLELMACGLSNNAIGATLHLNRKTIEAIVASLFMALGLVPTRDHNRRVLAVLAYLEMSQTACTRVHPQVS